MSEHNLDSTDREILKLLFENSRYKNTDIAKKLKVSEGAIRKRISRLVDNNIIEKFTIQISDNKATGVWSVVQVEIEGNAKPSDIRNQIVTNITKGIDSIYETAGDIDLILVAHTSNEVQLKESIELIRNMKGVKSTKTYIVLQRTVVPSEIY